MAITVVDQIVNVVRRALGDLEGTQFKLSEILNMLYNSVEVVNAAIDTTYTIGEGEDGTTFGIPPSTAKHKIIIGLQCAVDLLAAKQTSDALNGESGVAFKSGMNTYDNRGKAISVRDSLSHLREQLSAMILSVQVSDGATGSAVDLYSTSNIYLEDVL